MFLRKTLITPSVRRVVARPVATTGKIPCVLGVLVPSSFVPPARRLNQYDENHHAIMIVQRRCKHGAKKGLHLQKLEEMGHEEIHEKAVERRKKHKEKNEIRKSIKHKEEVDEEVDLPEISDVEEQLQVHVDGFHDILRGIRGSEPKPEMFDDIQVTDAYGKNTGTVPLNALAQVVIQQPTLAVATCYDPSTSKAVCKAIQIKLELNPNTDENGNVNIPIPRASKESRQQSVKLLHELVEKYKQRIRHTRQNVMGIVKEGIQGRIEGISKDDAFRRQKEIENVVDKYTNQIHKLADEKHDEIMKV